VAEPPGPDQELARLSEAIVRGDRAAAVDATSAAIAAGAAPGAILDAATGGMGAVGHRFACNEIYVPEMLIAARAMKASMALLEPLLVDAGVAPAATAVIGTAKGDLHDIGKDLVATMWRSARLEVVDLGSDVPAETFVEAVRDHDARVVGVSALLTTTMGGLRDVVDAVRSADLPGVRVVVGGAPVTPEFAASIGADGTAADAASAATLVRRLLGL
jgi:5-methyltetrahydrofolate--homocysteine methyltransferase